MIKIPMLLLIIKPNVTKPNATKVPEKEVVKNTPVKNSEPVSTPTPPAPKPKAVFKGVVEVAQVVMKPTVIRKEVMKVLLAARETRDGREEIRIQKIMKAPGGRGSSGVSISGACREGA